MRSQPEARVRSEYRNIEGRTTSGRERCRASNLYAAEPSRWRYCFASATTVPLLRHRPRPPREGELSTHVNLDARDAETKLEIIQHELFAAQQQSVRIEFMLRYGDAVTMDYIYYPSGSDLIPGYVFRPKDGTAKSAAGRMPAIVLVHGGFHERLSPQWFKMIAELVAGRISGHVSRISRQPRLWRESLSERLWRNRHRRRACGEHLSDQAARRRRRPSGDHRREPGRHGDPAGDRAGTEALQGGGRHRRADRLRRLYGL
jgi:hypothetical protein